MQPKLKALLSLVVSIILIIPLYILLHESGHAIILLLCGAKIIDFSIISAHVSTEGGVFNSFTSSLNNVAGMLLPVMTGFLYMLCYRKDTENIFYRIFSFYFCLVPIFSTLAWVIIPITYLSGNAPAGDDVTKFLDNSGIHPLWVIISILILQSLMIFVVWRKRMIRNYIQLLKLAGAKNNTTE